VMGSPDMDGSKFAFFNDPDGNGWVLQEAPSPLSER
jgi:hypothetical protein